MLRSAMKDGTPPLAASAMRGLILVLIVVAAGWGMFELVGRLGRGASARTSSLAGGSEGR